ncbi:hypothetical protein QJS10_CPA08g01798 [Acorus calamus]|uniref:Uncharacterized protein n=1 Tax=Acorus calamus TaxID=4465 RepID=A0AAV9EC28_ACOCL|nr:hypothetical protein QJS10_CPA08g01798 [Acorus calamus]
MDGDDEAAEGEMVGQVKHGEQVPGEGVREEEHVWGTHKLGQVYVLGGVGIFVG